MTLFGKKRAREQEGSVMNHSGTENPFLKPGDIIRLKTHSGKFQVASTDHDGFTVRHYPVKNGANALRCNWDEFKHWSRQ